VKPTKSALPAPSIIEKTMNYYAGIDVSLEESCICVIDANGKVVRKGRFERTNGADTLD
jgi:hypothetical protein